MKTEKVICDGCGRDLTTRTNIEDYRLVLASESKPGYGDGAYTCMAILPAISRSHHFCGMACLDCWRDREKCRARVLREHYQQWESENCTTHVGPPLMTSCPEVPKELRQAWESNAEEAALAAFPMKAVTVRT